MKTFDRHSVAASCRRACHPRRTGLLAWLLPCLLGCTPALADTWNVGAGQPFATLDALFAAVDLEPGDIVEVRGGQTYAGDIVMPAADGGAPGNPVTLRGIRVGGQRPVLQGGTNTIEFRLANHIVFEGFEVVGSTTPVRTFRCVYHHGHDLVIRDALIHHCPRHGVLGADQDSGSLTIEYSEIHSSGDGDRDHSVYVATDEVAFPGSVFRLQYSYLHSATGGNLVKSRAERNEIRFNWLEGGRYHELELIGPDPAGAPDGWREDLVREDSEVIGNVIVHTRADFGAVMRFGGDATGQSNGRYTVSQNTIIAAAGSASPTIFRLFDGIEAVTMNGNVIHRIDGGPVRLIREVEAQWVGGVSNIGGSDNWYASDATFVPQGWSDSVVGIDPGFVDAAGFDLRPAAGSPLLDAAAGCCGPSHEPPQRAVPLVGLASRRRVSGSAADIGAFERPDPARIFADGFGTP